MKSEYTRKSIFFKPVYTPSSIKNLFEHAGNTYGNGTAYKYVFGDTIVEVSYNRVWNDIRQICGVLDAYGLRGKHIAIVGNSSYLWIVSYLSVVINQSVIVPLDKDLPPEEFARQLLFADVACILADDVCYEKYCSAIREHCPAIDVFFSLSDKANGCKLLTDETKKIPLAKVTEPESDQLAVIVFTSGTTGSGKAVMLSQGNLTCMAADCGRLLKVNTDSVGFSILPLHHMFEIATNIFCAPITGSTICINEGNLRFKKDVQLFKPDTMLLVPLFVETIYSEIIRNAKKLGMERKLRAAIKLNCVLRKAGIDLSGILFRELLSTMGGRLKTIVCGGAALSQKLIDFFDGMGVTILQGYGITECSPVVSSNTLIKRRKNTVGLPFPFCEVKIDNGEIAVRGANVMMGYYKNEEETRKSLREGWLYTGDLGEFDRKGFLKITGRKKTLIILSNGQNVAPEELETLLMEEDCVLEAVVKCMDGMIAAEVYPDLSAFQPNTDITQAIRSRVDAINHKLPPYKQLQKIIIRNTEFKKTTTRKILRT
jgi:long-chain acyl-CoA synthetase